MTKQTQSFIDLDFIEVTQADLLEVEMREICGEDPNSLYDEWYNANDKAKFHGAYTNDGWCEWEFGDQSLTFQPISPDEE